MILKPSLCWLCLLGSPQREMKRQEDCLWSKSCSDRLIDSQHQSNICVKRHNHLLRQPNSFKSWFGKEMVWPDNMPKEQMSQTRQVSHPTISVCSGKCCVRRSKHRQGFHLLIHQYHYNILPRIDQNHSFPDRKWPLSTCWPILSVKELWREGKVRERSQLDPALTWESKPTDESSLGGRCRCRCYHINLPVVHICLRKVTWLNLVNSSELKFINKGVTEWLDDRRKVNRRREK